MQMSWVLLAKLDKVVGIMTEKLCKANQIILIYLILYNLEIILISKIVNKLSVHSYALDDMYSQTYELMNSQK